MLQGYTNFPELNLGQIPEAFFPFHCFSHDSCWYRSTQWERASVANLLFIWCITLISAGSFVDCFLHYWNSVQSVYFLNAVPYYSFLSLTWAKNCSDFSAMQKFHVTAVWLHFHKEFCSTTIASWTQSPFMLAVLYVSTADVCSA